MAHMKFSYFLHIYIILLKFSASDVHISLLFDYPYREGWHSKSHTLIRKVNEFLFALATFMVQLGENRFRKSECNAVNYFRVS
jgi:hypothetical protein